MERSVAWRGYNAKLHSPLLSNASPLLYFKVQRRGHCYLATVTVLATTLFLYFLHKFHVLYEGILRVVGPMHYFWKRVFLFTPFCFTPVLTKARRAEGGR